jgi:hypothetical protein
MQALKSADPTYATQVAQRKAQESSATILASSTASKTNG